MKLDEFISRFEALSDTAFRANFTQPFILEAGRILDTGKLDEKRQIFMLRAGAGRSLVVGRGSRSDIRIPTKEVSNQHAALIPSDGDGEWSVLDTNSTNGTFVNGQPIEPGTPFELEDCCSVRFGPDARFTYFTSGSFLSVFRKMTQEEGQEEANFLADATDPALKVLRDPASDAVPRSGQETDLLLCCKPFDPIPLLPGTTVIIGRSPKTARMVLPHPNVSRKHAEVVCREDAVYLRDLGSANGTFIGKTRVGEQPMELLPGKVVYLGPFELVVEGPTDALTQTTVVPSRALTSALEGDLRDTPLLDLFNEIEMGQVTGTLVITSKKLSGRLSFRAGEPLEASTGTGLEGDEAIAALMELEQGTYLLRSEDAPTQSESARRRVTRSFSELALEEFLSDQDEE